MIQSKFHEIQKKKKLIFYDFINREATPPNLELLVTLNVTLSSTDRLALVNGLFENNVTYNASYILTTVQIVINTTTQITGMRYQELLSMKKSMDRIFFFSFQRISRVSPVQQQH
jgi:hypothetical protein